jgi:CBS domain-containing protein
MLEKTNVESVMTRNVATLTPDATVEHAARLFATRHITGAPVVDTNGRPVGVVSQSDVMAADKRKIVADVMTAFTIAVTPSTPLLEAMKLMVADDIHRVLVLDGGRLVGILTTMDVVRAVLKATG